MSDPTETTSVNPHLTVPLRRDGPPPAQATLSAVLVHGRGQSAEFMTDVASRAALTDMSLHLVLPEAAGASWYPARFNAPMRDNEPALTHALQAVDAALAVLAADGVPIDHTVLVGFSQGACLLAEHLVRNPRGYAAVVLLTGCDIGPDRRTRDVVGSLAGVPVLMSSSEHDEWVPPERVRRTADLLTASGAAVDLRVHAATSHGVDDDEVQALRGLLGAAVARHSGADGAG